MASTGKKQRFLENEQMDFEIQCILGGCRRRHRRGRV